MTPHRAAAIVADLQQVAGKAECLDGLLRVSGKG